jgi:hypothetical protein
LLRELDQSGDRLGVVDRSGNAPACFGFLEETALFFVHESQTNDAGLGSLQRVRLFFCETSVRLPTLLQHAADFAASAQAGGCFRVRNVYLRAALMECCQSGLRADLHLNSS